MKFYYMAKRFISLLMFGLLCVGCEPVIEKIPITMKLSTDMLDFESDGGERTITVETNTINWKVESAESWLTVRQSAESMNGEVTVTAERNTSSKKKEATVTVTGTGIETRTIRVSIAGAPQTLSVSPAALNFPAAGGQRTFDITSNTDWTIGIDTIYDPFCFDGFELDWWLAGWLKFSQEKGTNDRTLTVTADANPLILERTQTITIYGHPDMPAKAIKVTQEGINDPPRLLVSRKTLNFPASGWHEESFEISSNTAWTMRWDADWFFFSECTPFAPHYHEGRLNGRVPFGLLKNNPNPTPRTAMIIVSGEGGAETQTIEVTQEAGVSPTIFGNNIIATNSYGGGNGTQNSPYLIYNAQQLKRLVDETNSGANYANTYFKLMTDIEVTANEWIPIGFHDNFPFSGNFDGNNHAISGTLQSDRFENFGFFGVLGKNVRISNLTIAATVKNEVNSSTNGVFTGAVAGELPFGNNVIINCHSKGMVKGGMDIDQFSYTGGILGIGQDVSIQNCDVSNQIIGPKHTGGIVGGIWSEGSEITNCTVFASASIQGYIATGGIAGVCGYGQINNCINHANVSSVNVTVSGLNAIGGIVGEAHYGIINNCTNHATISGAGMTGGIVGVTFFGVIIHTSLNTGNIISSNYDVVGGLVGNNQDIGNHIYSCCTNRGTVNGQAANANNQIGDGRNEIEPCPDGHTKR